MRVTLVPVLLGGLACAGSVGIHCETALRGPQSPWPLCRCLLARDDVLAGRAYQESWSGRIQGPDGATALFEDALKSDAASPYRWCDLGEAMLDAGQPEIGKRCLLRAVDLGPHMPQILLRAANFHFRLGASDEAIRFTARVLALVPNYDSVIFNSYSRMGAGTEAVLDHGLPRDARAVQAFFRYTLSAGTPGEAAMVWEWMGRNSFNDDRLAGEYVTFLIRGRLYETAANTWAAQMGTREEGYLKSNWLCNESFAREPSGSTFDWRITPVAGVQVTRDSSAPAPGGRSLRIEFPGTTNLAYSQVAQAAFVKSGVYRFSAMVRTAEITTDEGVGFRIADRENPGRLDIRTRQLRGTSDWTRIETVFQVPAGTSLLEVQVFRAPSLKFDDKIQGTAWITQVRLERAGGRSPE